MPSVWSGWSTISELLEYGSTLILGAYTFCGAHLGPGAVATLQWLDSAHIWVVCTN